MPVPASGQEWPSTAIRAVTFEPDGSAVVEYCVPAVDARANGVIHNHTLYVPAGIDYDDELAAVTDAVKALLDDVLEDLPLLPPAGRPVIEQADEQEDDDDDQDDDQDDE